MSKQVISGLFAMSVVAMWWTEADAHTCVAWQNIGGTNTCVKWSTKGVVADMEVKGTPCAGGCTFTAMAESGTENVVFCKKNGKIRKRNCPVPQSWAGSAVGCERTDGDDDALSSSDDDDDNGNGCKVRIVPSNNNPLSCQSSCLAGEVPVDVTPVTVGTMVTVCNGSEKRFGVVLRRLLLAPFGAFAHADPTDQQQDCGESSCCTIAEQCTTDRNNIEFNKKKKYQCDLQIPDKGE